MQKSSMLKLLYFVENIVIFVTLIKNVMSKKKNIYIFCGKNEPMTVWCLFFH